MLLKFIKLYSYVHEYFHEHFSINLKGLGFLYRRIKKDQILIVKKKKLFLNHKIADNYGRLINGRFNEPETHLFLDFVFINDAIKKFHFIDIGCNIGEFILDYASRPKVKYVTAFDPQPEQIKSVKKTIELNNFTNVTLVEKPVSNSVEEIYFNFNSNNSTASGINQSSKVGSKLLSTTIDESFEMKPDFEYVFLIDTEGAELNILKGGHEFIQKAKPLIIFEYNHVTRKCFEIDEVQEFLGNDYSIYRLRKDGCLDKNFTNTWNLVALPNKHEFAYLQKIIF